MNRRMILLGMGSLLVAWSCAGRLFTLRIRDDATTVVPRGTIVEQLVGDMGFGDFFEMDLMNSEELRNQGVEPGDLVSAELTAFALEAVSPEGSDLAFLERVSLFVEAPGLPRVLLASADAFEPGETRVVFDVTGEDIVDHVTSRSLTLTTSVRGRRPAQDTTVKASFEVRVGVTGRGACNNL
jgi:hypothetical protein